MPGQVTHADRIKNYAQGLCVGDIVTASQVVVALGKKHIDSRTVAQTFQYLPYMEFQKGKGCVPGTWRRV